VDKRVQREALRLTENSQESQDESAGLNQEREAMHKYVIELETTMMLAKMLRIIGRIEKLVQDRDHSIKQISILETTND